MTNYRIQAILDRYEWERRNIIGSAIRDEYQVLAPTTVARLTNEEYLAPPTDSPLGSKVIHITDMGDFCTCKRKWNWSSMLRCGLQPSVTPVPLFFGSAIHFALDHGYRDCIGDEHAHFNLKRALGAFKLWLKGHIKKTIEYTGPLWEFEKEKVDKVLNLGAAMLRHYSLWAEPLDKLFRMIGTEYKFRVPLPGFERHGLEYAGRFDGYIEDIASGNRYILEFKTAKSIRSRRSGGRSSNIAGVLRGMQSAAYTWASGQVYDQPAQGVLYRFMCKDAPDMPKPLQRGGYSRAKTIKSSVAWFRWALKEIAVDKVITSGEGDAPPPGMLDAVYASELEAAAGALSVLRQRQELQAGLVIGNEFFLQVPMRKKRLQLDGALTALVGEGKRMTSPDQVVYPTSGFHCNWCSFKTPCDLIAYGHEDQVPAILDAAYGPRTYWEPEVQDEY